jgi:hypothetical protein
LVYVGVVTASNAVNGVIEVRVQNGYELDEIHDVSAQNPSNNDGIFYNSTTELWEKKSIATVLGYTPEQPLTFSDPLVRTINAISIKDASATDKGVITTAAQTFAGAKTFNSNLTAAAFITPSNSYLQLGYGADANSRSWRIKNDELDAGDLNILQSTTKTGTTYSTKVRIKPTGEVEIGNGTDTQMLNVAGRGIFSYRVEAASFIKTGGTSSQFLKADGSVDSSTYLTAAITSLNGLTAATQTFATGTTGTDFGISSSSGVHTFNIPSASATARGLITTGAQTIAGSKTFTSLLNIQENLINATTIGSLIIQKTGESAINILGTNYSSIYFGDAANNIESAIVYDHTTNKLELRGSGNTTDISIESNGNTTFSGKLIVSNSLNEVASFESPNANTWVDLKSTTATWSIGSTASNSFQVYTRSTTPQAIKLNVGVSESIFYTALEVNGILSAKGSTATVDNIRFYNTDGNYAYIRVTPALNTNNTWYDAPLGANMWYAWDNPGQSRTANTYTIHKFGTGRGTSNESIEINRGRIYQYDSSGSNRITLNGLNGSSSFDAAIAGYAMSITNVEDTSQGLLLRATDADTTLYLARFQSSASAVSTTWVDRFSIAKNGSTVIGDTIPAVNVRLWVKGEDQTASNYALDVTDSVGGSIAWFRNDKSIRFNGQLTSNYAYNGGGTGMIHLTSSGTEGGSITFEKTSGTAQKYKFGNSGSALFIYNETAGNQPFTITNGGNVLIGKTTNAGGKLQVSNGTNTFNVDHNANGAYLTAATDNNVSYRRLSYDASEHIFLISATEKLTLTSGGALQAVNNITANSPSEGNTGEGIIAGRSFKIDATGSGQSAKMYVVSKDLSDTYGNGLQIQFAKLTNDAGFGFNLNTSGGFETYVKAGAGSWVRQMLISQSGRVTMPNQPSLLAQPDSSTTFTTTGGSTNCYGWNTSGGIRFNVGFTLTGSTVAVNNVANAQNTGKITVPAAGKYLINISIRNETEKGSTGQMYVWVNGTMRIRRHIELWDFNDYIHSDITAVIDLSANDYLEFGAWWNAAGVNGTIQGTNDTVNWLSIVKVN